MKAMKNARSGSQGSKMVMTDEPLINTKGQPLVKSTPGSSRPSRWKLRLSV